MHHATYSKVGRCIAIGQHHARIQQTCTHVWTTNSALHCTAAALDLDDQVFYICVLSYVHIMIVDDQVISFDVHHPWSYCWPASS